MRFQSISGFFFTLPSTENSDWVQHKGTTLLPSQKISTPEDQAKAVLYLISDLSTNVTGTVLSVDGGFTAGKLS